MRKSHEVQRSPNLYLDREVKDLVLRLAITSVSTSPKAVSSSQLTTEVVETMKREEGVQEVETVVVEEQVKGDNDEVDLT